MRLYELMFITRPDLEEDKLAAVASKYQEIITSAGGQVKRYDKWGRRRLAYEIKGQREGVYVLLQFEGDPAITREIDRLMKIDPDILRHMIVLASASSPQASERKPRRARAGERSPAHERQEGNEPADRGGQDGETVVAEQQEPH